jgi:hypothetical protein
LITRKRFIADLLFGSQLVIGVFFAASRIVRMSQTLEGVLLAEFFLIGSFCALNWSLAIGANRDEPSRSGKQTIITYAFWTVVLAGCIVTVLSTGKYQWGVTDTVALAVAAIAGTLTVRIGWSYQLPIDDGIVRGYLAMIFKSWPQLMLAYKISQQGGAGLPLLAVVLGHVTILIRLLQLWLTAREAGWNRKRKGSMISEVGNELTWLVTTFVWLIN